jgi:hypothetical protein
MLRMLSLQKRNAIKLNSAQKLTRLMLIKLAKQERLVARMQLTLKSVARKMLRLAKMQPRLAANLL